MATPAQVDLFDHDGPWSEQDFLALPEDRRIELLDGELLMSPAPRHWHQLVSSRLWATLDSAAPAGLRVLEAVNVRVGPGRILIPDLAVVTKLNPDLVVSEAADVAMVVEIVSPGSVAADRAIKPQLYAAAGIPTYLRLELAAEGASAVSYGLDRARYGETGRTGPGGRLVLVEPFRCEIELPALVR